jgi:putative PIN family toxin of toxin-antitoxin system
MRIIIDTNIVISGLFFKGLPKKLLSELDELKFEICVNEEIFTEYTKKINQKILKPKYHLDKELRNKFFSSLQSFEIKSDLKVCRDPDDDKFINCAIDAKAIYIVSGDNDLLTIKNFAEIEIVTAREFYEKYFKSV